MTYCDYFTELTGQRPYPYQERVANSLSKGQSVILRAPTGAGKTWSAVAPYLYSRTHGEPIADRLLYALPLRALARDLYASISSKWLGSVSLQIGGQADDPFFESEVVLTTIDQLLSSYLLMPVGLSPRLDNMNAGALPGALIIVDEIHLLDPTTALGTLIEMLDRLRLYSQFVLMTATLSEGAVSWLAEKLGAVVEQLSPEEVADLPTQKGKQREWRWESSSISAEAVIERHQHGRSIVLCNTTGRAQRMYLDLRDRLKHQPTRVLLLHSRFFREDRIRIEDQLQPCFGPNAIETDVILVCTQVIEAGVDISAEQMHTELAPMNALVQRAGRVARYPHRNRGCITVYETNSIRPYTDEQVIAATRIALQSGGTEEDWIEQVHGSIERSSLQPFSNLSSRRRQIHRAMDAGDRGDLTKLVRDISSINVLVTAEPSAVQFQRKRWPATLSIPPHALTGIAKFFQDPAPAPWVAQYATEPEQPSGMEWTTATSFAQARAQWLLAIHPDFASYRADTGLMLGVKGQTTPVQYTETPPRPRYQYDCESWSDHAQRVVAQSQILAPSYRVACDRLATFGDIEWLVGLTSALHDAGKLAKDWQAAAWAWQSSKDGDRIRPRVALAHTTWRTGDARTIFPPHAVEGAFIVASGVFEECVRRSGSERGEQAARAVCSAVARHHGPRSARLREFELPPAAVREIAQSVGFELRCVSKATGLAAYALSDQEVLLLFENLGHCIVWPLYVFLVRRLRLADQAALEQVRPTE